MKRIQIHPAASGNPRQRGGFTLVEALMGMAAVAISFISLYSGLTFGLKRIQFAREDQRATQILVEKMEAIRLYNWSQVTAEDFVPETFSDSYYPSGATNGTGSGTSYTGTIEIEKPNFLDTNYDDEMRLVTVSINWTTGTVPRNRVARTYVSEFGMHNKSY